jgi:hypothetical protein
MTVFYSQEMTGFGSLPVVKPSAPQYAGDVFVYQATISLASQATTDTIVLAYIPSGNSFLYGLLSTDTSLGSSTIAIGITGTTGKYRAAAVFTATNTPTLTGLVANSANAPLAAPETQFITIAVATLPASGILVYQQFWAM